jgi:hypothetical protein
MDAYNLADLERRLTEMGWSVTAQDQVVAQPTPGDVHLGGYTVALTDLAGTSFRGEGLTRSDAFRAAARNADLLGPNQPHLR